MTTIEEKIVNSYLEQLAEYKANIIEIRNALTNGEISVDSLKEAFINKIVDLYLPSDLAIIAEKLKEKLLHGKGEHFKKIMFPEINEELFLSLPGTVIYIPH